MRLSKYIGMKFGVLEVVDVVSALSKGGVGVQIGTVRCSCGCVYTTRMSNLLAGRTKSCASCREKGRSQKSAAGHKHELYKIWCAMVNRCYKPETQHYTRYGGRGIKVDDRWLGLRPAGEFSTMDGFKNFIVDMGPRPKGYWLDRKDNHRDYTPDNCRWATAKEQQNNKSSNVVITALGKTMTKSEWCGVLGMTYGQLDHGAKVLGSYHAAVEVASNLSENNRSSVRWSKYTTIP